MQKKILFSLTGADPANGNCGLGALAFGTLEALNTANPDAEIMLLDYYKEETPLEYLYNSKKIKIQRVGLRFSWKPYLHNNIFLLISAAFLCRALPLKATRKVVEFLFPKLKIISQIKTAYSISGGDSFSDIYGLSRFLYVILPQILFLLMDIPLIHLPQTYGPFKRKFTSWIAKVILKYSQKIYARDHNSLEIAQKLSYHKHIPGNCSFSYDVGFLLKPSFPDLSEDILTQKKTYGRTWVGVNISGLLLNGGYTGKNQFDLCCNYKDFCCSLIDLLISKLSCHVLLIPHVFDETSESDLSACRCIYQNFCTNQSVSFYDRYFNSQEIKGIIGICDFFTGARMHACIGAISQCIPSVPIAYSRKFFGVMKSINYEDSVIDLRTTDIKDSLLKFETLYSKRYENQKHLNSIIPTVKLSIRDIFTINKD